MNFKKYINEQESLYIVTFTYNSEDILDGISILGKDEKDIFNKAIYKIISKFKENNINKSYSHLYSYYSKHPDRYSIEKKEIKNKKTLKIKKITQGSLFD